MSEIKVIDDFLNEDYFEGLKEIFYVISITMDFDDILDDRIICDQKYNYQYVICLYQKRTWLVDIDVTIDTFFVNLEARSLVRCKD